MIVRGTQASDRQAVEALLSAAGLPVEGVEEHFGSFFVAVVEEGGRIAGAAGLERYGEWALLRSVVVANDWRGTGLGSTLTRHAVDEARARGVRAIFLLTTTAAGFFPRFGFAEVARAEVPLLVHGSREFQGACPASAIAMRHLLQNGIVSG
jgi:amino-acid N-acetyltransferase